MMGVREPAPIKVEYLDQENDLDHEAMDVADEQCVLLASLENAPRDIELG
jgi:hypothetical protein